MKDSCRGDIMCVFLLSMMCRMQTCIHLKEGKTWSMLLHNELLECCSIHMVYLGSRIFLRCKCQPPVVPIVSVQPPILGTVHSDDSETLAKLMQCHNQPRAPMAAAGSRDQLAWVKAEMKVEMNQPKPLLSADKTIPKVELLPLSVNITRLSQAEIKKHTRTSGQPGTTVNIEHQHNIKYVHINVCKLPIQPNQSIVLSTPKPKPKQLPTSHDKSIREKPHHHAAVKMETDAPVKAKVRKISGHPSKVNPQLQPKQHIFKVKRHILPKRKNRLYLRCCVRGCTQSFVTFHSVCNLNTHHRVYHSAAKIKCAACAKKLSTLSAAKYHKYLQAPNSSLQLSSLQQTVHLQE